MSVDEWWLGNKPCRHGGNGAADGGMGGGVRKRSERETARTELKAAAVRSIPVWPSARQSADSPGTCA